MDDDVLLTSEIELYAFVHLRFSVGDENDLKQAVFLVEDALDDSKKTHRTPSNTYRRRKLSLLGLSQRREQGFGFSIRGRI